MKLRRMYLGKQVDLPIIKEVCSNCLKWKRIYMVGYHTEETGLCEKCLKESRRIIK